MYLYVYLCSAPNLDDLQVLKPSVGKHLRHMLQYEGDDFNEIYGEIKFEVNIQHYTVYISSVYSIHYISIQCTLHQYTVYITSVCSIHYITV